MSASCNSQNDFKSSKGTTARKRRLMLNEDAACSSVNFAQMEIKSNLSSLLNGCKSNRGVSNAVLQNIL